MIRPAPTAVSQLTSDTPPMSPSRRASAWDRSRVVWACHAAVQRSTTALTNPSPIAENFTSRTGLSSYSRALAAKRQTPLAAASAKPAIASGAATVVIAASGARRPHPQQPQIENEHGTEKRRDTEDMNHVYHGIGPRAGAAHEHAERRRLQPGERPRSRDRARGPTCNPYRRSQLTE